MKDVYNITNFNSNLNDTVSVKINTR